MDADEPADDLDAGYSSPEDIDFSTLTTGWRRVGLLEADLYLGMQGMNVGIVDQVVTLWEYELLREYFQREHTPGELAMQVSAFSQMWVFAVYELMRVWRERLATLRKWSTTGGFATALKNLEAEESDNLNALNRRRQIERCRDDPEFLNRAQSEWDVFAPIYRQVELMRMNLAKHAAPGRANVVPRAPGYARINMECGSLTYEVIDEERNYSYMHRRDIAESLRKAFRELEKIQPQTGDATEEPKS